jgi:hypothetical protein
MDLSVFHSSCFKFFLAFIACYCITSGQICAQDYRIEGTVYDKSSGETLPFANVFLANTTFGASTDTAGYYNLGATRSGTYMLTVKYLGFGTFSQEVALNTNALQKIDIYLVPLQEQVEGVEVTSSKWFIRRGYYETDDSFIIEEKGPQWRKYFRVFQSVLLGGSRFASGSKILNPEVLSFEVFKDKTQIFAFANKPIKIENNALGYELEYVLESFELDLQTRLMTFHGYPYFKTLEPRNIRQLEQWQQNRWEAYRGSLRHFLKSLYANELEESGFETSRMPFANREGHEAPRDYKTTSSRLVSSIDLYDYVKPGSHPGSRKFSMDALLLVTAANSVEEDGYVRPPWHEYLVGQDLNNARRNLQRSWIEIKPDKSLEFDSNGYIFNPLDFAFYGYWSFKMLGDMLPLEYQPSEFNGN